MNGRKRKRRWIAAGLIAAAYAISIRWGSKEMCLGDAIFTALGWKVWSVGVVPIRMTMIPAILLLSIGFLVFLPTLDKDREFRDNAMIGIVFLILLAILVTSLS